MFAIRQVKEDRFRCQCQHDGRSQIGFKVESSRKDRVVVCDLIILLKKFTFLRYVHVFIIAQRNGLIHRTQCSINQYLIQSIHTIPQPRPPKQIDP